MALFLLGLLTVLIFGFIGWPAVQTYRSFPSVSSQLETYDLFDIGVVDANSDGSLDIFTTNHSARQSLVLNSGASKWNNALDQLGLSQDRRFPGLEDTLERPEISQPGLYVYRYNRILYLQAYKLSQPISGQLTLSWGLEIGEKIDAEANIVDSALPNGGTQSIVKFTLQPNALLAITGQEDIVELPHLVLIEEVLSYNQIFIGINRLHPESNLFELMWRDRHSFAWADINQDQEMDAFILRGGVKGQLDHVPDAITDELMVQEDSRFANEIDPASFSKKSCPGRQSAWVDFNHDDRLDLYVICGRHQDPAYPNQLHQQQQNGEFVDVASRFGLDFREDGTFKWLDFDNDGDTDLIVTRDESLWLYSQSSGEFKPTQIKENFPYKILNLLTSDFDSDGDSDIYVESKQTEAPNLLLLNIDGHYEVTEPQSIGLPSTGVGASWVDYDNDGHNDFFIAPHGLYRQRSNRFEATHLLRQGWNGSQVIGGRSIWADFDNDGYRDFLGVTKKTQALPVRMLNKLPKVNLGSDWEKIWLSALHHNNSSHSNQWLELDLLGSPGNLQAIGAKVVVKAGNLQQTQLVGDSESSYFSQGHYRLYFGLAANKVASSTTITWPDGQTQEFSDLGAGKIWTIQKGDKPLALS